MSLGDSFSDTVVNGSLLLALGVAAIAGLVSFLSPCVLPLVPGYLSYVTGLTGVDLASARRGRMLLGALLFVLGFTVVFVSYGVLFGGLGTLLLREQEWITGSRCRDHRPRSGVHGIRPRPATRVAHLSRSHPGPGGGAAARRAVRDRMGALHRSDPRHHPDARRRSGKRGARSGAEALHTASGSVRRS